MPGENYYLITALPELGELGSVPPMSPQQLLEHVGEGRSAAVIEVLLMGDDLLLREAILTGQIEEAKPVVLTGRQMRNEEPLPEYLIREQSDPGQRKIAVDAIWEAYFHHASTVATRTGNALLRAWVRYEVALRNALAIRRAKMLELDEADYLVASDLEGEDEDFTATLNEWSLAINPLAGLQVLDRARWGWLCKHERSFSFADDELAAYAAKLILVHRWARLMETEATETIET